MENEALLFKKMQLGDWTAFNLFFKEYMEQLYLYAVAFVKDRAAAEDIVQDSFIYLWTNRGKINFTGSIYAYLLLAVKNACINYKAHQQVEEKYRATFQADGTTGEGEEEWEELRNRVMRAIDCLPPKCREIGGCRRIEIPRDCPCFGDFSQYSEDTDEICLPQSEITSRL